MTRRLAMFALLAAIPACTPANTGKAPVVTPPLVIVATATEKTVTDYAEYTGQTDAVEKVDVRARVSGYITEVGFAEGKDVKKGDLLFVIDPRPYEAEHKSAVAQIDVARAKALRATQDLVRAVEQRKTPGVISQQEFDKFTADKAESEASVKAAEATAEQKRLNVEYTRIIAPISGRISKINYTAGNLIAADKDTLTSLVTLDPIYVYFDIDERTVLEIQKLIREGKFKSARKHEDVAFSVALANDVGFPYTGQINFVDNKINPGTGTIKIRGVLANPAASQDDRIFTAGLFVRVRINMGEPKPALLVTDRAVGTNQGQKFVYVVTDQNVVVERSVTLGQMHEGMRAVESGLAKGERIIVNGLQRVRAGVTVDPKTEAEAPKPAAKKG